MKRIVEHLLLTGTTNSKKRLSDFVGYCSILKYILTEDRNGQVVINNNSFWKYENNENRLMFANLLSSSRKRNVQDLSYFKILNTMSNGNRFGIDTHISSTNKDSLSESIYKWYKDSFPEDELGDYINQRLSFKDLYYALCNCGDIYSLIGVGDSVVRERIFYSLSVRMNVSYDVIYNKWLNKI